MKKKSTLTVLFLITVLAVLVRFYRLDQIPPGLNRDEAAIGYTAYSLLKTGADEYGVKWPLSFKSFGDWKVPIYFYLLMPFVKIGGLTEFTTRLPSALLGTLTVIFTFWVTYELFNEEKNAYKIALSAALILSLTPWHIFMSRNASESNIAVFLVLVGIVCFLKSFRYPKLIIISFLFLALSLYTYHANHIFTPLLIGGICILYRRQVLANKWFVPAISLFILLAGFIYSLTLFSADKTKISGLSPLGDLAKIYQEIVLRRLEYNQLNPVINLIHNRPVYFVRTVINNYIKGFSPEFLFITGGSNAQHNIPDFGNLYIWEVITIPFGLFLLFKEKSKHRYFLFFWLLIAPIAASITKDAPHTNRMMPFLPLPAILSAHGLLGLITLVPTGKWFSKITAAGIIGIHVLFYLDQYFLHFPYVAAKDWGYGFKELVSLVTRTENRYSGIFIDKPEVSPYIYFLFYQRFDPDTYKKTVVRYPETTEGFQHVHELGNLTFEKNNWTEELLIPNRLYIGWAENTPSGATNSATLITKDELLSLQKRGFNTLSTPLGAYITTRLIHQIKLPNGSPLFYFIETNLGTPSAQLE